ncbi:MAG: hypothetical protein KAG56_04215 [Sulfurovaceae bacterium]|nr:hypothetical protein [Sulfurovaceae bacterium]
MRENRNNLVDEEKKELFSDKIRYLFNNLELDREDFIKLFWDGDKKTLNTRVKTVNSWLDNDIKTPKGFYFDRYNISKEKIEDDKPAFTIEAFIEDECELLHRQVDEYLVYQAIPKDELKYKYIYYYDSHLHQVTFVELKMLKRISDRKFKIEIIPSIEYEEKRENIYTGDFEIDKNYYHISARNHFEILSFYFILHLGFKNDDVIYGLRLGKAYGDGLPLSAKNLLTKRKLTKEEEIELYLNINETEELKSKEAFYGIYSSSIENHFNRFQRKIANLATYSSNVREILNDEMCEDIYHNIMSKEFFAFSEISKKVKDNNSYYIHNIRRASKIFLKSVAYRKVPCYIVSPLIENLSLLNKYDSKAEQSLRLNMKLAKDGLKIYRIFVINRDFEITEYMRMRIEQMIDSGISVRIVKEDDIKSIVGRSYNFIYSKRRDIAIYRKPRERFYIYHVTKNKNVIEDIDIDYKTIESKSYTFSDFLKQENPCNQTVVDRLEGNFFHYSYGSKEGKKNGQLHFWNNRKVAIDGKGEVRYFEGNKIIAVGQINMEKKQSCISMIDKNTKNSISMSFDNADTGYDIFKIIKIDKQFMEDGDMVSIGLFSREKLEDSVVKELLGDEEKTVFIVPSSIKKSIAKYCSKKLR